MAARKTTKAWRNKNRGEKYQQYEKWRQRSEKYQHCENIEKKGAAKISENSEIEKRRNERKKRHEKNKGRKSG